MPAKSLLGTWLVLALLYAGAGWLAHAFVPETGFASIIWAPAGIALGSLLACGRHLWPGVLLGATLINAYLLQADLSLGNALLAAACMGLGATGQALLGEFLCRRFYAQLLHVLPSVHSLLRYFQAVLLSSLVSALLGTSVLLFWGLQEAGQFNSVFFSWWIGDSLGSVLITPVVMACCGQPRAPWKKRRAMLVLPLLSVFLLLSIAFFVVGHFHTAQRAAEFERHVERLQGSLQLGVREAERLSSTFAQSVAAAGGIRSAGIAGFVQQQKILPDALKGLAWVPAGALSGDPAAAGKRDLSWYFVPGIADPAMRPEVFRSFVQGQEGLHAAVNASALRVSGVNAAGVLSAPAAASLLLVVAPAWSVESGGEARLSGLALAFFDLSALFDLHAVDPDEKIAWRLSAPSIAGLSNSFLLHGRIQPGQSLRNVARFSFGGEAFLLQAAESLQQTAYLHRSSIWLVYLGGLSFSVLLCFFLLRMSSFAAHSERLIEERTRELERSRQEAEKAIKLLREAVDSIEQGFTIYDEHDRLVICNEAYLCLYEASRDLIVPGATFEEIVRKGAERGQYAAAIGRVDAWVAERVAQHQKADGSVLEQNLGDGRWLMVVEYRTPSGFIAGNRIDISRIKQAAQIIEDRNAQLDTLFSLSPDGFVAFDRQGLMKFANPAFYRMTGLQAEEMIGHDLAFFDDALRQLQDRKEMQVSLADVPQDAAAAQIRIVKLVEPEPRILQIVSMLSDAASISRIFYVRDITHETEISRMKSEFLAHAAHELRTPMTSILGFTELLLMRQLDEEKQTDILQTVHRQTRWLVNIINELLDLARIEARRGKDFRREETDLVALVQTVLHMQAFDPVKWPLSLSVPDAPVNVQIDVAKFQQALTNVLGNAHKYSPQGGPIAVRVFSGRQVASIEIQDAGIGMSEDELLHYGERFWRADRSGKMPGTGLGMSIVKEIVELHGGSVTASSVPGQGTRVMLTVPRVGLV